MTVVQVWVHASEGRRSGDTTADEERSTICTGKDRSMPPAPRRESPGDLSRLPNSLGPTTEVEDTKVIYRIAVATVHVPSLFSTKDEGVAPVHKSHCVVGALD